jgi:hypothetical protein
LVNISGIQIKNWIKNFPLETTFTKSENAYLKKGNGLKSWSLKRKELGERETKTPFSLGKGFVGIKA